MATIEEYRGSLRSYLKDFSDLNRLLKFEEENSNDMLDLYLNMSLGSLNMIPPLVQYFTIDTFPAPALLLHSAAVEALTSNGIMFARNELTYNNGNVTVKIMDKDRYLPMLQTLYRSVEVDTRNFTQYKVAINIDNGWGGISSPYNTIFGQLPIKPNSIL